MIARFLRNKLPGYFESDESGQTLVEYGLIIALIALLGFVGVVALHGGVGELYGSVQQAATAMANALG